jgi:hypothetical protein
MVRNIGHVEHYEFLICFSKVQFDLVVTSTPLKMHYFSFFITLFFVCFGIVWFMFSEFFNATVTANSPI